MLPSVDRVENLTEAESQEWLDLVGMLLVESELGVWLEVLEMEERVKVLTEERGRKVKCRTEAAAESCLLGEQKKKKSSISAESQVLEERSMRVERPLSSSLMLLCVE
jgi:hypothetical protein